MKWDLTQVTKDGIKLGRDDQSISYQNYSIELMTSTNSPSSYLISKDKFNSFELQFCQCYIHAKGMKLAGCAQSRDGKYYLNEFWCVCSQTNQQEEIIDKLAKENKE